MISTFLRELKAIFTTSILYNVMLGGSVAYVVLFGCVYFYGRVTQIPIMVVDQDHSAASRSLIRAIESTDSLFVKAQSQDLSDFFAEVRTGDIMGCVVIPRHFEADIESGRQTKALVYVDGGNVLIGNVIIKVMRSMLATFRAGARAANLTARGTPNSLALANALPIQAEARPIFNPTYNYAQFMLIGLACIALQQCALMGAAVGLGRVKIDQGVSGARGALIIFFGKSAAHFLVMSVVSALVLSLPFLAFKIGFHGDWKVLAIGAGAATLVNVWCGLGFAGLVKNLPLTLNLLLCASVPTFLVTGYTWPLFVEPAAYQWIANVLPLTHYYEMARCVALKSSDLSLMLPHLLALCAWLPPAFLFGWWGVARKVRAGGRDF